MSKQNKYRNQREYQKWQCPVQAIHAKLPDGREITFMSRGKGVSQSPSRHQKVNRLPYDAKARAQAMRVKTGTFGKKGYVG